MPPQNTKAKQQNQGGGIGDKFFSLIVICALIGGAFYFIIKNDISSIDDFTTFIKEKSNVVSECSKSEDGMISCLNKELLGGEDKEKSSTETAPVDSAEKLEKLGSLTIAEPKNEEYDRTQYKHWITLDGSCNTREFILKTQGIGVEVDSDCSPIAGEWIDPYSENVITESSKIDIDHVIPLNYANSHGAASWSSDIKEQFANDTTQLLAVSASENRKKSDSGPSEYMPPNKDYHCEYASLWVDTAYNYQLSITSQDRDTLEKTLQKCG